MQHLKFEVKGSVEKIVSSPILWMLGNEQSIKRYLCYAIYRSVIKHAYLKLIKALKSALQTFTNFGDVSSQKQRKII